MDRNVYLLATDPKDPCRDVIHSRDTDLKVRVFCVNEEPFDADGNEIQLYGYVKDKLYAFETVGITPEDAIEIVSAIQWYAKYIHYPELEILPEDPRQGNEVALEN